ncbi:Panacea domain-containing protein [Hansschlegelia zhihuaiae]|uniref:DUF4065 domain-containing protein n=1 Tax=Hansschlegelia zhihuaiae TaxID=405005 RepID=A0A4Q0M2M3_9HYPH|nr:DUF4065 domain-containing protein [Hansschlegelia zhihuaiae]
MADTLRAAKTICELRGWSLSNLPLQKLLYLSHMVHLGRHGQKLAEGPFEAWDLGPVEPRLYRKVKAYGGSSIPNIFSGPIYDSGSPERDSIEFVLNDLSSATPARLVAITHQPHGAWAQNYRPNITGIVIPDDDIRAEYVRRMEKLQNRAVPA